MFRHSRIFLASHVFVTMMSAFAVNAEALSSTCDVHRNDVALKEDAGTVMTKIRVCIAHGKKLESEIADFALQMAVSEFNAKVSDIHFNQRMVEQAFIMDEINHITLKEARVFSLNQLALAENDFKLLRAKIVSLRE